MNMQVRMIHTNRAEISKDKIDSSQITSRTSEMVSGWFGSVPGVLKLPFHDIKSSGNAHKNFYSHFFGLKNAFLKSEAIF